MSSDYLLKKYGVAPKGTKVEEEKKRKKKKKEATGGAGSIGAEGLKIVDQDEEGWKKVSAQSQNDQSDIYQQMLKHYRHQQEGFDEEEIDELEGAQIVESNFKKREDSQWQTIDLNETKSSIGNKESRRSVNVTETGDESPPRKTRHDSPDASPPRRTRHDSPDASPPRRTRHDSPDGSPPRKKRHDSPDASPPRRTRHDSPDASPPRKKKQDDDASPPRRTRHDSPDASPPRKRGEGEVQSQGDQSPPRKRAKPSEDALPPGKDPTFETIYRDKKTGKKVDVKLEKLKAEEKRKKEEEEASKHMVWGKGLVQQKEREENEKRMREVAKQPFAVYKKDLKNDETLRNRDRWGDPMAGLVSKGKEEVTSRPKYKGPHPPNRFDIPPGYRWDGVDRSNGFEKQLLAREASKESMREEAYRYSVADM